jgi:hypothetical protein
MRGRDVTLEIYYMSTRAELPRLLPTTLVGSYPQPEWLIDRARLAEIVPPRARARELWRVGAAWLEQAQDDATVLAIRDQERAGIDIVTDGEMRRESYSNRFATALEGMDSEHPAQIPARTPGRFSDRAARHRQDPTPPGGAGPRCRISAHPVGAADQDHHSGAVYDDAAAA